MYDFDFRLEFYDDDEQQRIQAHYWQKNGRFYLQYDRENGTSTKTKRISEAAFISAIEELYNA